MKPQLIINPKGTQRVKSGHPWVFRSDIVSVSEAEPGDLVYVSSNKNQFLGQGFYSPRSQITLRMLTRSKEEINRDFWKRRIEASLQRRAFLKREAKRLIFGEADLLPSLILDQYGKVLVFQTLSAGMDRVREDLISIFEELLSPEVLIERNDPTVRDLEGLVRQRGIVRGSLSVDLKILEGQNHFLIDPLEGQKTGLFLDQADNHLEAAKYARGRVLDLFTYQGGFALAVSRFAEEVIAVDSSGPSLELMKRNCQLNNINNMIPTEANAFDYLRACQNEPFDMIILDPPPFVRDRKNLSGGIRGYKEINLRAIKLLKPGGILITCSCSQNFGPELFYKTLQEATHDARRGLQILEQRGAAPDHPVLLNFPESAYLQCWIIRVL